MNVDFPLSFDSNFEPPIPTCRQHGPAYITGDVCTRCVDSQFEALVATQLTAEVQEVVEAAVQFIDARTGWCATTMFG